MRRTNVLPGLAATLLAIVSVSCSPPEPKKPTVDRQSDARICQPVPPQGQGQWAACLHLMAYKYAHTSDPAETVAEAAVAACADRSAQAINSSPPSKRLEIAQAIDRSEEAMALQRVIEARAGRCDIPK